MEYWSDGGNVLECCDLSQLCGGRRLVAAVGDSCRTHTPPLGQVLAPESGDKSPHSKIASPHGREAARFQQRSAICCVRPTQIHNLAPNSARVFSESSPAAASSRATANIVEPEPDIIAPAACGCASSQRLSAARKMYFSNT